ncbi:hypothetical protein F66182_8042 [Fusarium sp. NRRL 66182]|nr:hypothetical protein F66182_8042 [Fusarium sp. NRRL 66182]
MYGLKNLIILALARCTEGGRPGGRHDASATETSCREADGSILNGGSSAADCAGTNHAKFDDRCKANTGQFSRIGNLRSTCGRK